MQKPGKRPRSVVGSARAARAAQHLAVSMAALVDAATSHALFLPTDVAREMAAWALRRSPTRRIDGGWKHSVALKSDSSLVSWGRGDEGQVRDTPTGAEFDAVAAGGYHSVALKSDGSLVSWGRDNKGQVRDTPILG